MEERLDDKDRKDYTSNPSSLPHSPSLSPAPLGSSLPFSTNYTISKSVFLKAPGMFPISHWCGNIDTETCSQWMGRGLCNNSLASLLPYRISSVISNHTVVLNRKTVTMRLWLCCALPCAFGVVICYYWQGVMWEGGTTTHRSCSCACGLRCGVPYRFRHILWLVRFFDPFLLPLCVCA